MKKIILGVGLVVLGLLAGYVMFGMNNDAPASSTREELVQTLLEEAGTDPVPGPDIDTVVTDYRELPEREGMFTPVVSSLDAPWAFEVLPNGDFLVTERFGTLRLVADGELISEPIAGVPEVFTGGQGGLLDVTIHPNFTENRYVYLSYAHGSEEGNRLRVARGVLNGLTLEDIEVIFEVAQTKTGGQHFGSRFTWLPDNTLLFSVGDGGNPPISYNGELIREQAQNLGAHLGKIIRINDDGSVPEDNPFVGRPDVLHEIFSYGHRNVQGITYDTTRERVLASEHGSKGGDELNEPRPGANYGWPLATYSTEYAPPGASISDFASLPGAVDPLIAWTPTIAPSAVAYYNEGRYGEAVDDSVFLAAMLLRGSDSILSYIGNPPGALLRVTFDEAGMVSEQERIMLGEVRVRSLGVGQDGYLYVLTDQTGRINGPGTNAGTLWRLESLE